MKNSDLIINFDKITTYIKNYKKFIKNSKNTHFFYQVNFEPTIFKNLIVKLVSKKNEL